MPATSNPARASTANGDGESVSITGPKDALVPLRHPPPCTNTTIGAGRSAGCGGGWWRSSSSGRKPSTAAYTSPRSDLSASSSVGSAIGPRRVQAQVEAELVVVLRRGGSQLLGGRQ